jgi:hypothetical protein
VYCGSGYDTIAIVERYTVVSMVKEGSAAAKGTAATNYALCTTLYFVDYIVALVVVARPQPLLHLMPRCTHFLFCVKCTFLNTTLLLHCYYFYLFIYLLLFYYYGAHNTVYNMQISSYILSLGICKFNNDTKQQRIATYKKK